MSYLESNENYNEVAEEGKTIGFYFQIYSREWMAFGLYKGRPVICGLWATKAAAEARIVSYHEEIKQ